MADKALSQRLPKVKGESRLVWQGCPDDSVAEPPIVVVPYSEMIELTQRGKTILVNVETIDELCRAIKAVKKDC